MLNFSNIWVQMCCAGNDRVDDLYAAAFNILMNTCDSYLTVMFNTEEMTDKTKERRDLLKAMAEINRHVFEWIAYPEELSKAQMIEKSFKNAQYHRIWTMNVDDDYMIPYRTLLMIHNALSTDPDYIMLMYGQYDIINYKGHKDWSSERLRQEMLLPFVEKYGRRLLVHHLMEDSDVTRNLYNPLIYEMPGQSTGSHLFRTASYLKKSLIRDKMRTWPKGKRGYDGLLCNGLGRVGWIMGSNSYHTDRTKEHLDGVLWKEDVFRDDMRLDGKPSGRRI